LVAIERQLGLLAKGRGKLVDGNRRIRRRLQPYQIRIGEEHDWLTWRRADFEGLKSDCRQVT